jgi:hypothetical protein
MLVGTSGRQKAGGRMLMLSRLKSGRNAARKPDFWPSTCMFDAPYNTSDSTPLARHPLVKLAQERLPCVAEHWVVVPLAPDLVRQVPRGAAGLAGAVHAACCTSRRIDIATSTANLISVCTRGHSSMPTNTPTTIHMPLEGFLSLIIS